MVIPATKTRTRAAASQAIGPPKRGRVRHPSSKLSPRQAPMNTGPSQVRFSPAS